MCNGNLCDYTIMPQKDDGAKAWNPPPAFIGVKLARENEELSEKNMSPKSIFGRKTRRKSKPKANRTYEKAIKRYGMLQVLSML